MQNTDYIVSTGDDMTIRIWRVPPQLVLLQLNRMMENGDKKFKKYDEDYCVLNMVTRHTQPIIGMALLGEQIVTASKDHKLKVYNVKMIFKYQQP